jgi:hypothetical protein
VQIALPWATLVDVSAVGQHGYNIVEMVLNTDLGPRFATMGI